MHPDTNHRGRLLYVALGFLGLDVAPSAMPPELRALHAWLDTWHGIGLIAHGLARQDRDLSLTRYRDRWGASVFVTGREHSIVQGSGCQMTPWAAVPQAAFQALHRGGYWSDDPRRSSGNRQPRGGGAPAPRAGLGPRCNYLVVSEAGSILGWSAWTPSPPCQTPAWPPRQPARASALTAGASSSRHLGVSPRTAERCGASIGAVTAPRSSCSCAERKTCESAETLRD
jgi:hypothetical protein